MRNPAIKLKGKTLAKRAREIGWKWFRLMLLVGLAFVMLYPLLYMLSVALQEKKDMFDSTVYWIPKHFTMENISRVFEAIKYPRSILFTLPPVRCKSDYDGFYVDNSAIYVSKDDEKDWNCFLTQICRSIRKGYPSFQTRMCWKPSETGESIYVLMENHMFDLIADTGDKYSECSRIKQHRRI